MLKTRLSKERGYSDQGWLRSYHTFSFANYYDPTWMGFRSLRVINEDRVAPGKGFAKHAHANMEILSYVIVGSLAHQDSLGTGSTIVPGEIQRMTAGTGITHSEFNPSPEEWTHFLQIWILPSQQNLPPSYEQRVFAKEMLPNQFQLIASSHGDKDSVTVHQDVTVFRALLEPGQLLHYPLPRHRYAWLQLVRGSLQCENQSLRAGDGAAFSETNGIELLALTATEFLFFDLA